MRYCPVGLVLPLHYSATIEKVAAILYKGTRVIFTMRILVSSILVQNSEEIPALNDIVVLHLLSDGSHFGLRPPRLTHVQFHMPQYLKTFIV